MDVDIIQQVSELTLPCYIEKFNNDAMLDLALYKRNEPNHYRTIASWKTRDQVEKWFLVLEYESD